MDLPRLTQRSGGDEPQTQSHDHRGLCSSLLSSCSGMSSSGHACDLTSFYVRVTDYITSYSYVGTIPHMFLLLLIDLLKSGVCSLQRV